jgi:hypothetical protein
MSLHFLTIGESPYTHAKRPPDRLLYSTPHVCQYKPPVLKGTGTYNYVRLRDVLQLGRTAQAMKNLHCDFLNFLRRRCRTIAKSHKGKSLAFTIWGFPLCWRIRWMTRKNGFPFSWHEYICAKWKRMPIRQQVWTQLCSRMLSGTNKPSWIKCWATWNRRPSLAKVLFTIVTNVWLTNARNARE